MSTRPLRTRSVVLPELELPGVPITVVAWLVRVGEQVLEGDRLLEILAGEVAMEIDSPATGILIEKRVDVEDAVALGQVLGVVRER